MTVSADQIKAAEAKGLINVVPLAKACDKFDVPFYLAATIMERETGGQNIFGHDAGGAYSVPNKDIQVTEARYKDFLKQIGAGKTSNGVGPMQLTYKGYHFGPVSMQARGFKAWEPADNIRYGVEILSKSLKTQLANGLSLEKAFWNVAKIYNAGKLDGPAGVNYANGAAASAKTWAATVGTSDTEVPVSHAKLYPGADHTSQWRGDGGATMASVNKLLLHTTETADWPGYPGFEPTLTFHPWKSRGHRWRQHLPINGSASTLQNAGTFRTNRANVCQIEIVAYCDPARKSSSAHISKIDDDAYHELGEFWAWIHQQWEVPLHLYPNWKPYPASYGSSNGIRMSVSGFSAFKGVCGHQHAPGNDHGDPGDLEVDRILAAAIEPQEDDMPTAKEIIDELIKRGPQVGAALAKGYLFTDVVPSGKDEPNPDNKTQVPATYVKGDHDLLVDIREALTKLAAPPPA